MGPVQHVGAFGTAVERSGACNVRVTKKREILCRAGLQHVRNAFRAAACGTRSIPSLRQPTHTCAERDEIVHVPVTWGSQMARNLPRIGTYLPKKSLMQGK